MADVTLKGTFIAGAVSVDGSFSFDASQLPSPPPIVNTTPTPTPTPVPDPTPVNVQFDIQKTRLFGPDYPYNQPGTKWPADKRQLTIGNVLQPLAPSFLSIYGTAAIQFGAPIPVNYVDSSKTPDIFESITVPVPDADTDYPKDPRWVQDDPSHVPTKGAIIEAGDDKHILVVDVATNLVHELYGVVVASDGTKSAAAYRKWDYTKSVIGQPGQNSAEAAGGCIVSGLLRYDEVLAGPILHALRMTFKQTRQDNNNGYFTSPACHSAGTNYGTPTWEGQRFLLRADFPMDGLTAFETVVITALKTYGLYIADNGISGMVTIQDDPRFTYAMLLSLNSKVKISDLIPLNTGIIVDAEGLQAS